MTLSRRLLTAAYGASLVTLPLVGVGVLRLSTGRDWGGGLQPAWVFMALAWALALRRVPCADGGEPGSFLSPQRALAVWLGTVLLSGLGLLLVRAPVPASDAWWRFGKQVVQLVIMVAFTVWAACWTTTPRRWAWTARMIVSGALLQAGYGVLQLVNHADPAGWFRSLDSLATSNPAILAGSADLYVGNAMVGVGRLRGTMCEPLYLGNFLLLALPLVGLTGWKRWLRALVAAVLVVLLILTWSRGAWLAGLASLVAGAVLYRRGGGRVLGRESRWIWAVGAVLAVLAAAVLVGQGPDLMIRRLVQSFSTLDWSNLTRLYSMQAAWRAFLLSPLVGVGWGQFGWHFPVLVSPLGLQSQFTWPVVNNFYLEILCETGLLGLAAFALHLAVLGRRLLGRLDAVAPGSRSGLVPVLSGMAFVGVWGQLLTFSQYNLPHVWISLGLLWAACRRPASQEEAP